MEITQEKFDAIKELSEIQLQIAEGRGALSSLKKTTEDYIRYREGEAIARVEMVLAASKEAIKEIEKNHDALTAYKNELTSYATDLKEAGKSIAALFAEFSTALEEGNKILEAKQKDLNGTLKLIRSERVALEEDHRQLRRERDDFENEKRLFKDRKETFNREVARIKNKK